MEHSLVARSYERYVHSLLQLLLTRKRIDRQSEFLLYRALLGESPGPILDLACGTGLFARRLARLEGVGPLVAMDTSRAMLEEASAQAREAGVMVDFVRAQAPAIPFLNGTLSAVLQTEALHYIDDAEALFAEVVRVLRPGGRYIASTYLPPARPVNWVHHRLHLRPRTEEGLRRGLLDAGLVNFERIKFEPFIVVKAERPP
jgi:ubiquinone/menaquinone biosynthesis C-methylase UbiE